VQRQRVFITGIGIASPLGNNLPEAFERALKGDSAILSQRVGQGDRERDVIVAPADISSEEIAQSPSARTMARVSKLAVVATNHALQDANLLHADDHLRDAGMYSGCGLGGGEVLQDLYDRYLGTNPRRVKVASVPMTMSNGPAAHASIAFGIRGPTLTYSIACASSTVSLGEAFRAIADGYLSIAVAGGSESMLNDGSLSAWKALRVIADLHPDGASASCRPFDRDRTGMVMGEGAAFLVLESEASVQSRGAKPMSELIGYGTTSDGHNLTQPLSEGQVRAMSLALDCSGTPREAVGYINAHATGTAGGDPVEIKAIRDTFGSHAHRLAVSSTKGVHGHLVGATGALEAALTIAALQAGHIPPTANLTNPDPACDLDCVPLESREAPDLEYAISNSFAFGGTNASLLFRKWTGS
jgi:3-oxoacyl-(acyl-carrier-protein) synthase